MKRPPFVLQKGVAIGLHKCCFDTGGGNDSRQNGPFGECRLSLLQVHLYAAFSFTNL